MLELRFQMHGVTADDRTIKGVVMPYNSVGNHPRGFKEVVRQGALTIQPGLFLNRFHQRITPLARLGKQLHLQDTAQALTLTATLPETATATDVLKEIDAGLLNGFSVEMRVAKDSWERGTRVIHKAHIEAIGLIDRPAYPEATLRWFEQHADTPTPPPKRRVRVW